MTSELGSKWYERKMEDFVGRNVRAQGAARGENLLCRRHLLVSKTTRGSQREFFEVYPYPAKNCGVAVPSRNWKEVADHPIFTSTTISRSILIKPHFRHGTNIITAPTLG